MSYIFYIVYYMLYVICYMLYNKNTKIENTFNVI